MSLQNRTNSLGMNPKRRTISFGFPEEAAESIPNVQQQASISVVGKEPNCAIEFSGHPISSFVTLSPFKLRFPYNDSQNHSQLLAIRNRTGSSIKCELKSLDPGTFLILLEDKQPGPVKQFTLYGKSTRTATVKYSPGSNKMERAYLELHVQTHNDEHEFLPIPLQIFPSTAWFHLPKIIMIPDVILGRKAHAIISLPQPTSSEKFFVAFNPAFTHESVTITPMNGTIGGRNGLTELKVTYYPTSFTTICCPIMIHFPGLVHHGVDSHEMRIVGRCRPGNEADSIRKEIAEIEGFRPRPLKQKRKPLRMALRPVITPSLFQLGISQEKGLDLFTPGGVMRFILSKNDDYFIEQTKSMTAIELFTSKVSLSPDRKVRLFTALRKRLGLGAAEDSMRTRSAVKFKLHQRMVWEELQKITGSALQSKSEEFLDFRERKTEFGIIRRTMRPRTTQRTTHFDDREITNIYKAQNHQRISDDEKKIFRNLMHDVQLDFTPKQKFIQLGRIVITRIRADWRIVKLRVLINTLKNSANRKSSLTSGDTKVNEVTEVKERLSSASNPGSSNETETHKKSESRGSAVSKNSKKSGSQNNRASRIESVKEEAISDKDGDKISQNEVEARRNSKGSRQSGRSTTKNTTSVPMSSP